MLQKGAFIVNTEIEKRNKKKKKSIGRIILTILGFVMLFLVTVTLTVAFLTVRPPDISEEKKPNESVEVSTETVKRSAGVYSVLVVGTDKEGLNTDTIMVASLDNKNKRASVMSIPRDTISNVNRNVKKINAAYAVGAKDGTGNIDNLKKEVSYLMGFPMDNYVIIDLTAFEELIDALGGVTIDVPRDMHYDDPYQDLHIHIEKGLQTLNGKEAIGFVRYRKGYAEGDLGRVKAQQMFISALAEQVATPATVTKLPQLTDIVLDNMKTDLTYGELVWFVKEAVTIDMSTNLHMFTLPGVAEMVKPEGSTQRLSYYLPYEDKILEIVNEYFNPYSRDLVSLNVVDTDKLLQQAAVQRVPVEEEVVDPTDETDGDDTTGSEEEKDTEGQEGNLESEGDANNSDEANTEESDTQEDETDGSGTNSDTNHENLNNDNIEREEPVNTEQPDAITPSNIPGEVLKGDEQAAQQESSNTVEEEPVVPAAPDEQVTPEEPTPTVEETPSGGIPGEVLKSDSE